LNIGNLAR